jgi:hypothetical protein
MAIPPISLASWSAASTFISNKATLAPSPARAFAVAAPMPEPPPVTIAATESTFIGFS